LDEGLVSAVDPEISEVAPSGFVWARRRDALALRADTRGAVAVFTTRLGGVCPPPYDTLNVSYARGHGTRSDWADLVTENRRVASSFLGGNPYWTRVQAGLFHDFHQSWSIRIKA
jgi:hypothetical protein